jgi:hypothetical protein
LAKPTASEESESADEMEQRHYFLCRKISVGNGTNEKRGDYGSERKRIVEPTDFGSAEIKNTGCIRTESDRPGTPNGELAKKG